MIPNEHAEALTVLVVEDDERSRRALERLLRHEGYRVAMPTAPPYAHGALRLLETEPIDVVVLDLALGDGMDGFDLARRMRDHPSWRAIPVILSSGLTEEEIRHRATQYAFYGMRTINLGKPLDPRALFTTLAAIARSNDGSESGG